MTRNINLINFDQSLQILAAVGNIFQFKVTKYNAILPWNAMDRQPYV